MRNWKEWFLKPEPSDQSDEFDHDEQARIESGTGHRDENFHKVKRKVPPRCAKCHRFMGFGDGMYIMITSDWRVHIKCFNEVLTRHFERGEALDLSTGEIVKMEQEDNNE